MESNFKADDFYTYDFYKKNLETLSHNEIFDRYYIKLKEDEKDVYTEIPDEQVKKFASDIMDLILSKYNYITATTSGADRVSLIYALFSLWGYKPDSCSLNIKNILDDYTKLLKEFNKKSEAPISLTQENMKLTSMVGYYTGFINKQKDLYIEDLRSANINL